MKKLKIKQKSNRSGFTLVELVIVIAIVIILSVISVPIYRGYVDKAKYSEAYALLGNILSAQKAYYSQYGNFLNREQSSTVGKRAYTTKEDVLGIDGRGNKYFTWFTVNDSWGDSREKYFFEAGAEKPADLRSGANTVLFLQYNITKGARIVEYEVAGIDYGEWR